MCAILNVLNTSMNDDSHPFSTNLICLHSPPAEKVFIILHDNMLASGKRAYLSAHHWHISWSHYNDVIMTTVASQITSLTVVYSTVYSDRSKKHLSSASLAFMRGIHRDRWIPRTKGQLRGKCFHLMTSSCILVLNKLIFVRVINHFLKDVDMFWYPEV